MIKFRNVEDECVSMFPKFLIAEEYTCKIWIKMWGIVYVVCLWPKPRSSTDTTRWHVPAGGIFTDLTHPSVTLTANLMSSDGTQWEANKFPLQWHRHLTVPALTARDYLGQSWAAPRRTAWSKFCCLNLAPNRSGTEGSATLPQGTIWRTCSICHPTSLLLPIPLKEAITSIS